MGEDQNKLVSEFIKTIGELKTSGKLPKDEDPCYMKVLPDPVTEFENRIAEFFGAPFGIATDSATHGLELCLRYLRYSNIIVPKQTYISIPMLANKLGIWLNWKIDGQWQEYYMLAPLIYDAAVLWRKDSYMKNTFMCISFQYQKHLSLGRGGMILTDNKEAAIELKKMSYDGRLPGIPWREQDIETWGAHYYMTPETAQLGLDKLDAAINTKPKIWSWKDYPDVSKFKVFNK